MKLREIIESGEKWVSRLFVLVGALCLTGIVVVVVLNVVMRFVFNQPLMWYLELCAIFVVWLAFLPLGANYYLNKHFIIDTFTRCLPAKFLPIQTGIVDLVSLVCAALLAVSALDAIEINGGMELNMIPLSLTIASYLPVVVGAVSYVILILLKYLKLCLGTSKERASA